MGFLDTQALQVINFLGGRVDDTTTAKPDQYARLENFLLNSAGKPYLRPSSTYFNSSFKTPGAATTITSIVNYNSNDTLLVGQGLKLYRYNSGWTELTGAAGSAFIGGTTPKLQWADWNNHLYFTNSEGTPPLKVYRDSTPTWKVRTAGLPAIAETDNYVSATVLASAITLANALRTKMIDHVTDVTDDLHIANDTVASGLIGSASTDLATLLALTGQLTKAMKAHIDDMYLPAPTYHADGVTPTSDGIVYYYINFLPSTTVTPTTLVDAVAILNDLWGKLFLHTRTASVAHNASGVNSAMTDTRITTVLSSGPQMNRTFAWIGNTISKLKSAFTSHVTDVTMHTASTTATFGTLLSTALNLDGLTDLTKQDLLAYLEFLALYYDAHDQDAETNGPKHPATESTDFSLPGINTNLVARWSPLMATARQPDATLADVVALLGYITGAYNGHDNDKYGGGGAHTGTVGAYQGNANLPDVGDYIYSFHYFYAYTVGSTDYEDAGPVLERTLEDALPLDIEPHTITNIPVLANSGALNYDVSTNLKIKIYRTTRNGSTRFYLDTISNGTTSYTDRTSDDDLSSETIYTTGGVVDNDPPPLAKYIHVVNDFAYYGHQLDSAEVVPQRIRQSIEGDLDSCPADFYVDLPKPVKGLASAKSLPLGFTESGIYRLEGSINELGQGALIAVPIDETVGLAGSYSPIVIDSGCVFAGTNGFYHTDGYTLTPLSSKWRANYQKMIVDTTSADTIRGIYEPYMGRIWWGSYTSGDGTDQIVVLDLNHGLRDPAVFTTLKNDNAGGFSARALAVWNNQIIRGNAIGEIHKFTEDSQQPQSSASDQDGAAGTYPYRAFLEGPLFDFGDTQNKKWIPKVSVSFLSTNEVDAQIVVLDEVQNEHVLAQISTTPSYTNWPGYLQETRRMRTGGFRCIRKQFTMTNDKVVTKSDTLGLAATASLGQLKLVAGTWPVLTAYPYSVYQLYTRINGTTGNYRRYLVTAGSGTDTLTVPGLASGQTYEFFLVRPGGSQWMLDNYTLNFAYLGGTHNDAAADTTGNAP